MYRNALSGCCGQNFVSTLPLTGFMTSGRMLSLSDPSFVPWENWNCDVILQGYFLGSNEIPFVKTFYLTLSLNKIEERRQTSTEVERTYTANGCGVKWISYHIKKKP